MVISHKLVSMGGNYNVQLGELFQEYIQMIKNIKTMLTRREAKRIAYEQALAYFNMKSNEMHKVVGSKDNEVKEQKILSDINIASHTLLEKKCHLNDSSLLFHAEFDRFQKAKTHDFQSTIITYIDKQVTT